MGDPSQGQMFFDRLDAETLALADPDKGLYDAFAVRHGGWRAMFGWASWRAGFRALRRGHFINRKIGGPWTLPTIVAIRDRSVVWEFRGTHASDLPDLDNVANQIRAASPTPV